MRLKISVFFYPYYKKIHDYETEIRFIKKGWTIVKKSDNL